MEPQKSATVKFPSAKILPFPSKGNKPAEVKQIQFSETLEVLICEECDTTSFYITPEGQVLCSFCLKEQWEEEQAASPAP